MFDMIYVQENVAAQNKTAFEKIKQQAGCPKEIKIINITQIDNIKSQQKILYIGNTKLFLEKASQNNAVIAVLNAQEDLFPYKYAVECVSDIDEDYVNLIYCRYYGIAYAPVVTERCILKEMNLENAQKYLSLCSSQPYIADFARPLCNKKEIEQFAKAYIKEAYNFFGYGIWSVYQKNTSKHIGYAGIDNAIIKNENYLMLSYYINEKERQKGYAYEVCQGILEYARKTIGVQNIYCIISEDNVASRNTAVKLQFKEIKKINKNKAILYLRKL